MNEPDLTKIQEYLEQSVDFVAEQAPLVAQEILLVGRLQYTLGAFAAATLLLAALYVMYRVAKRAKEGFSTFDSEEAPWVMTGFGSFITIILSSILTINAASLALTAWFAPRLYILEQLKDIL